jgi:peptidoglycan/xylan/chitin deacetylase (PgdA/CDA1 family)
MRGMTGLAAAAAGAVTLGIGIGWMLSPSAPAPTAAQAKIAQEPLVTGTIASRATEAHATVGAAAQPRAPEPQPPASIAARFEPATAPMSRPPGTAALASEASGQRGHSINARAGHSPEQGSSARAGNPRCENPDALGVSRTVAIDTAGGPGFGAEQFKAHDFLEPGEVVLTFDDGPWPTNTPAVLAALASQCVKATFFPIGKHSGWHPEILKQVVAKGHTVGSHSLSHANLAKKSLAEAKDEIEYGISAVAISAGAPQAPFFRFPGLSQTPELTAYLAERNIGIFSTDLDSFDFRTKNPDKVIAAVMTKLDKRGKGIVLLHDFQQSTAVALPALLLQLKAKGFKIVHLKAKDRVTTLPQYDAAMAKARAGQTADARPTTSVVRTIPE